MPFVPSDKIEVRQVRGKGRGVFARVPISESELIELVPVLVLSEEDMEQSELANYCFLWGQGTVALPLGFGALYNHSITPNAEYVDRSPRTKLFRALRDIARGEEITINYNGTPGDDSPVGFEVR
jgi:SET domain-containing protein